MKTILLAGATGYLGSYIAAELQNQNYPTKIVVSKVYLRILMTDIDGYKTEKIIIFEVPLDSQTNKNVYAKL